MKKLIMTTYFFANFQEIFLTYNVFNSYQGFKKQSVIAKMTGKTVTKGANTLFTVFMISD